MLDKFTFTQVTVAIVGGGAIVTLVTAGPLRLLNPFYWMGSLISAALLAAFLKLVIK